MIGTESYRRFVYALNLGGTGIRPEDSFSFRYSFRVRSRSSSCSTTSGDIFYCSGSRQLNHSSLVLSTGRPILIVIVVIIIPLKTVAAIFDYSNFAR